jgi:uncharacterized phage protein (TIGR01671 family)
MRDTKFRVWNRVSGEFTYFSEPYFTLAKDGPRVAFKKVSDAKQMLSGYEEEEQYTGLKDKNGREIYEGDILQTPPGNELNIVVKFGDTYEMMRDGEGYYGWYCEYLLPSQECKACQLNSAIQYTSIVISNIHEHSHLLKEKL